MCVQNLLFLLSHFVTEWNHVNFLVGVLLNALHGQVKKIQKHIRDLSDLQTSHLLFLIILVVRAHAGSKF